MKKINNNHKNKSLYDDQSFYLILTQNNILFLFINCKSVSTDFCQKYIHTFILINFTIYIDNISITKNKTIINIFYHNFHYNNL
jgi:hypothetical protein